MTQHYYSQKPQTESRPQSIEVKLRGRTFVFATDSGVFSKNNVDFGSQLLVETMIVEPTAQVLDVGCGYGPIGIVAASLATQGQATMIDINERAIELAKSNALRNGIDNIRVFQSDLLEKVINETYDVVVTNPPIRTGKLSVHTIFEQAHHVLVPGGSLWVVIQKKQGAPSAFSKLEQLFGNVDEVTKDKGYRIFRAIKGRE